MPIDPAVLAELTEKHPNAVVLTAEGDSVVVLPPSRAIWKRFRTFAADEKRRPDAFEALLRDCLVHPDKAGLEALLERRPGLAENFGGKLLELAGLAAEVEAKALVAGVEEARSNLLFRS